MLSGRTTFAHCSYHKCLTSYYLNVVDTLYNRWMPWTRGYEHFNSRIDRFYRRLDDLTIASVNNHCPDLDRLGEYRITRFVRDPRDLIVSGYFYHRRGAEPWCDVVDPTDDDWTVVNGHVPETLPAGTSYAEYLREVPVEEGLRAEIQFREHHFASMREWPDDDPHVALFRYEDILGKEEAVFDEMFAFYGASGLSRWLARRLAERFSAKHRASETEHIRDPRPEQWRDVFTAGALEYFDERHGDLLARLGYPES